MRAVVICFDKASHSFACLICIDVESVQELAYIVKGFELLANGDDRTTSVKARELSYFTHWVRGWFSRHVLRFVVQFEWKRLVLCSRL